MSLIEIFTQMDALGIGMLLGSLLFLGGLVWVLMDNKQFDEDVGEVENEVRVTGSGAAAGGASASGGESAAGSRSNAGTEDSPRRPPHSRRAA